ncbi:unnamed protein product [Protopolystoma xenopodis]|uniref:Uncharacterized protein n=1 Tax=Protopolystoma xenopodis TaxID=117903 RepID=A0A448XK54_9PLAT|nr:unnamed protein product [Protopolystoma xenopodis]
MSSAMSKPVSTTTCPGSRVATALCSHRPSTPRSSCHQDHLVTGLSHQDGEAGDSESLVDATADQFARRPTRASAPCAPHSLVKKIAALDRLAAGETQTEVAASIGVNPALLDQWRSNESTLRRV